MKLAPLSLLFVLINFMNVTAQTPAELSEIWQREHVSNILPSNVRHRDLQKYLEGVAKIGVSVEEVGKSNAGREIYQVQWGNGPLKIFLWSQMHGDEPTATSALIDMFSILQKNREAEWVKRIESAVTIRAVPMLNPDGAELYIRRNLQGIDINRDALDLKTPEAQLLKKLRDEWQPDIGFNLHNQNALTAAGNTSSQAAISFLVVYGDEAKTSSEGHERNKRINAVMIEALLPFIRGNMARYDNGWSPTAFGDNFSAWGTPVILIETGGLHGRDEMFLVKMNFIAILTAMKSLADGSEKNYSPVNYDLLPENTSGRLMNVIFRGAAIIEQANPGIIKATDIGVNIERRRDGFLTPAFIRRIGDLTDVSGLDEYDASGFSVVGRQQSVRPGSLAELLFYRRERKIELNAADLEREFPPDAIFSLGKWVKGGEEMKRK